MIEVVVDRGYPAATVTQVVAAAGVSRRTFYSHYSDKNQAFFEVYREVTDFICDAMIEAGREERGWVRCVKARLAALLACLTANPKLSLFTLGVPPAAGGEVAAAYRKFLDRLLAIVCEGRPKSVKRPPPAAEYGLVGGLAALILAAVREHGGQDLERLRPEAVEVVLTPYLGREAAAAAATATAS